MSYGEMGDEIGLFLSRDRISEEVIKVFEIDEDRIISHRHVPASPPRRPRSSKRNILPSTGRYLNGIEPAYALTFQLAA